MAVLRAFVLAMAASLVVLIVVQNVRGLAQVRAIAIGNLARAVPERTALMRQRAKEAAAEGRPYRVDQRWVPYDRISPLLRRAVLVAEDDKFYSHDGLDWEEIKTSMRTNLEARRIVRGGSTITQQLAKNLFLGDHRTLSRKLTEVVMALRLERTLSKRRLFELYLNLIEWGDGVYGAEAAARHYFHRPASALNERQALLLAAVIINPRHYSPIQPDRRIERRVRMIASRLRRRGVLTPDQYRLALGLPPAIPPVDTLSAASAGATDSTAAALSDSMSPEAHTISFPLEASDTSRALQQTSNP